jgi:hypothetical protein
MMLRASKSNTLTCQRSIVLRWHGIVQEALRVALLEEPSLGQTWPLVDSWLEACARMRDWEHDVALVDLVGFVGGNLKVWQGRLVERLRREQQEEGARLDQQIAESLRSRI